MQYNKEQLITGTLKQHDNWHHKFNEVTCMEKPHITLGILQHFHQTEHL
jgi:hypothetical protein